MNSKTNTNNKTSRAAHNRGTAATEAIMANSSQFSIFSLAADGVDLSTPRVGSLLRVRTGYAVVRMVNPSGSMKVRECNDEGQSESWMPTFGLGQTGVLEIVQW